MSSKLVRKGLELLHKDAGLRSQERKAAEKAKQPSKKRKGRKQKEQPVDFTEQNLEYFKKATWKIKGDTYDKILERQKKLPRNKNLKEKQEESDAEKGGLFDD